MPSPPSLSPSALVSVVIPTYNQAQPLALTLEGFRHQRDAGPFELVLVDDGSTDDTRSLVEGLDDSWIEYIAQPNRGRALARNVALDRARGDLIVFCDADAIPAPGFIAAHRRHHGERADSVVIGHKLELFARWRRDMDPGMIDIVRRRPGSHALAEPLARAAAGAEVELISAADVGALRHFEVCTMMVLDNPFVAMYPTLSGCELAWTVFTTRNASVPRALIDRVGRFDDGYRGWGYEDTDLACRLQRDGARFVYATDAANYHQIHRTLTDWREDWRELRDNYRRFMAAYPTLEVFLHWRYACQALDPSAYLAIVRSHAELLASGHTHLAADYVAAARHLATVYCALDDPSPQALARSPLAPIVAPGSAANSGSIVTMWNMDRSGG